MRTTSEILDSIENKVDTIIEILREFIDGFESRWN